MKDIFDIEPCISEIKIILGMQSAAIEQIDEIIKEAKMIKEHREDEDEE